jgi:hypothetical protein
MAMGFFLNGGCMSARRFSWRTLFQACKANVRNVLFFNGMMQFDEQAADIKSAQHGTVHALKFHPWEGL